MTTTPCTECGFALSELDRDCPRCKAKAERKQAELRIEEEKLRLDKLRQEQMASAVAKPPVHETSMREIRANSAARLVPERPAAWTVVFLVLGIIVFLVNAPRTSDTPHYAYELARQMGPEGMEMSNEIKEQQMAYAEADDKSEQATATGLVIVGLVLIVPYCYALAKSKQKLPQ